MVNSMEIQNIVHSNWFQSTLLQIKKRFPFLHQLAIIHVVAFVICIVATFIDDRQLTGVNVWVKPAKFLLSTFILLWTLGWYLLFYPFREKIKTFIAYSMTGLLTFENILISIQAGRGIKSHYNDDTPMDGLIFGLMGLAIGLITLLVTWMLIKSFSSKLNVSIGMKWGFIIAWFAFLFGSAAGGGSMIGQNAHSVGVADGGEGIPFLNWSTEGGDLRIAHFLGLHAIQVIPLVIYFIYKKLKNNQSAVILGIGFATLYLGWLVFTFYQAKAGQPLM